MHVKVSAGGVFITVLLVSIQAITGHATPIDDDQPQLLQKRVGSRLLTSAQKLAALKSIFSFPGFRLYEAPSNSLFKKWSEVMSPSDIECLRDWQKGKPPPIGRWSKLALEAHRYFVDPGNGPKDLVKFESEAKLESVDPKASDYEQRLNNDLNPCGSMVASLVKDGAIMVMTSALRVAYKNGHLPDISRRANKRNDTAPAKGSNDEEENDKEKEKSVKEAICQKLKYSSENFKKKQEGLEKFEDEVFDSSQNAADIDWSKLNCKISGKVGLTILTLVGAGEQKKYLMCGGIGTDGFLYTVGNSKMLQDLEKHLVGRYSMLIKLLEGHEVTQKPKESTNKHKNKADSEKDSKGSVKKGEDTTASTPSKGKNTIVLAQADLITMEKKKKKWVISQKSPVKDD